MEYEGEYLYNKKWNGKGYDEIGNIIYELKNGTGKVKEYFPNCKLKFEGEYLNGKKNGKGKKYYDGRLEFEGEYLNGKKWEGKGYDLNNNIIYKLKEGKGFIKENDEDDNLIFEGEYLNGERNGKGKEYYKDKLVFESEYLYGYRLKGKYYINERLEYEGEYLIENKYNKKDIMKTLI